MNATADPSGEMVGLHRSASGSSAMTVWSPDDEIDPHQHRVPGRARCGQLPGRHHEPAVGADVEVGVAQRPARSRRQVDRRRIVRRVQREQMWSVGPEVLVPVSNRIAGVQDRGDLVVLAQLPQPTVVVDACPPTATAARAPRSARRRAPSSRPRPRRAAKEPRPPRRRPRADATAPRAACRRLRSGAPPRTAGHRRR